MILYLVRHAIAIDRQDWKKPDAERPLTEKGIGRMKENAKGMKHLGAKPDVILTSPCRRAYDTAQIIGRELKMRDRVSVSRSLQPDGNPQELLDYLTEKRSDWKSVMLVGHEPYLSTWLAHLIGCASSAIHFKKGGLAVVEVDARASRIRAQLHAVIPPRLLRSL